MKTKYLLSRIALAVVCLTTAGAQTASAVFIDPLDTTNNFFNPFGGLTLSASSGEVTLSRTATNTDALVDWQIGGDGGTRLSLLPSSDEHVLAIRPVTPVNGGFYSVQILFFSNRNFLVEHGLIPDTNSSDPSTNNIAAFAFQNGLTPGVNSDEYFVRIRVLPTTSDNSGFTFTEIAAIPEPTSLVFVAVGVSLLGFLRRKV